MEKRTILISRMLFKFRKDEGLFVSLSKVCCEHKKGELKRRFDTFFLSHHVHIKSFRLVQRTFAHASMMTLHHLQIKVTTTREKNFFRDYNCKFLQKCLSFLREPSHDVASSLSSVALRGCSFAH